MRISVFLSSFWSYKDGHDDKDNSQAEATGHTQNHEYLGKSYLGHYSSSINRLVLSLWELLFNSPMIYSTQGIVLGISL